MLGALAPGTVFAGYTIERVLGYGGTSAVYLARHPNLPRNVALKLLHIDNQPNEYARAHFEREAEIVAGLEHPNIVAVFDRGREDAWLWIAMQYIDGVDAGQLVSQGPVDLVRATYIATEAGRALDYAHRNGILHRDVKPANILISRPVDPTLPERVLMTDFGIAMLIEESQRVTKTGDVVATLSYASPEQIRGEQLDARTDVYSLGCTTFQLLAGHAPYSGPAHRVMYAQLNDHVPRIREARPDLPPSVEVVLATAMAKDRNARYRTCAEFTAALEAAATGQDISAATTQSFSSVTASWGNEPKDATQAWSAAPAAVGPSTAVYSPQTQLQTPVAAVASPVSSGSRGNAAKFASIGLAMVLLFVGTIVAWKLLLRSDLVRGSAGPVEVTGVKIYSPEGTPDHAERASNAVDGDPSTYWVTDQYFDNFPSLKDGVGLLVELSRPVSLSSVKISSPSAGTHIEIRAADDADPRFSDTAELASATLGDGDTTVSFDTNIHTQFALIWITSLPSHGSDFQATIDELSFTGR